MSDSTMFWRLKKGLLCLLLCIHAITAIAQKQTNNWLFGYGAGLDFNVSPPALITGGQIHTREGVATISDEVTGELLFYSDGTKAWNASHQLMPNGDGLLGDYSSTQSAVIVPHPGNEHQYFLFTDDYHGGDDGYHYSIVDMSLDGGLGDIVPGTKNTLIYIGHSEKMIAIQHCNGRDYWLVTHEGNTNRFHVHPITANGIGAGQVYQVGWAAGDGWQNVGYLKASADGKQLANAIGPTFNYDGSRLEVFDFDPATGAITGPTVEMSGYFFAYGVEFSSNGNLLYLSELQSFNGTNNGKVIQYNLQAGSSTAVQASAVVLKQDASFAYGALQRASNGRIYVSKEFGYDTPYGFLDVIQSPNVQGTGCGYATDAVNLGSGSTLIGLPTFALHAGFPVVDFVFEVGNGCTDPSVDFEVQNSQNLDSVQWFFGDSNNNFPQSTDMMTTHTYPQNGSYTVQLITFSQCSTDTLTKTIAIEMEAINSTLELTACAGEVANYEGLDILAGDTVVFTYTNWLGCDSLLSVSVTALPSNTQLLNVGACPGEFYQYNGQALAPGSTYFFTEQNQWGCTDSTVVEVASFQPSSSIQTLFACPGDIVTYDGIVLQPGDVQPFFFENWHGCDSVVLVSVYASPPVSFELAASPSCWNQTDGTISVLHIIGSTAPYQFSFDGTNFQPDTLFANLASGNYAINLLDVNGCSFEETIMVPEIEPIIVTTEDKTLTCGESVLLGPTVASPLPITWVWRKEAEILSNAATISVSTTGLYGFTVSNECESRTDSILVSLAYDDLSRRIYLPNSFSPNGDGINDCFTAFTPSDMDIVGFELMIFDRWGDHVFKAFDIAECWDGNFRDKPMNPAIVTFWLRMKVRNCTGEVVSIFKKGDITIVR